MKVKLAGKRVKMRMDGTCPAGSKMHRNSSRRSCIMSGRATGGKKRRYMGGKKRRR